MNLYKRQIKPVKHNAYCAMGVYPTNTPLEDAWYDESEEVALRNKYENSFKDYFDSLVFAERYIKIDDVQNNRLELLEDK